MGAFFWSYFGYSYSGLGITEYTEFQFRKERSLCFGSGNGIGGDLRTTISAHATGAGGRVGFPTKNFPKERIFCLFRVNRIPSIPLSATLSKTYLMEIIGESQSINLPSVW